MIRKLADHEKIIEGDFFYKPNRDIVIISDMDIKNTFSEDVLLNIHVPVDVYREEGVPINLKHLNLNRRVKTGKKR